MAFLFFNNDRRDITEGVGNIGSLKIVIENTLKESGFIEVRRSDLDVFGIKPDVAVVVSIAHFPIGGRSFHEVVMAAGDSGDVTKNTRDEVVNKLRNLKFFD
jgi:hypothetical protein